MKKNVKLLCILFFIMPYILFGQSNLYEIKYYGSVSGTSDFFKLIDTCYARFNRVFHFDDDGPGFKYPVSLFSDIDEYKEYVRKTGTAEPKTELFFCVTLQFLVLKLLQLFHLK